MNKKVLSIIIVVVIIVLLVIVGILFKPESNQNYNTANSNGTVPESLEEINNTTEEQNSSLSTSRNKDNVKIEVISDTVTNESAEILITDNNEIPYGWGVEFRIQQKINEEWEELKYVSDDIAWISIAYVPNENNQLTQKLNIKQYYGTLSSGTYRIVKPVYDNGYIDFYSNEFEIK